MKKIVLVLACYCLNPAMVSNRNHLPDLLPNIILIHADDLGYMSLVFTVRNLSKSLTLMHWLNPVYGSLRHIAVHRFVLLPVVHSSPVAHWA